jgi:hypothetical protein
VHLVGHHCMRLKETSMPADRTIFFMGCDLGNDNLTRIVQEMQPCDDRTASMNEDLLKHGTSEVDQPLIGFTVPRGGDDLLESHEGLLLTRSSFPLSSHFHCHCHFRCPFDSIASPKAFLPYTLPTPTFHPISSCPTCNLRRIRRNQCCSF